GVSSEDVLPRGSVAVHVCGATARRARRRGPREFENRQGRCGRLRAAVVGRRDYGTGNRVLLNLRVSEFRSSLIKDFPSSGVPEFLLRTRTLRTRELNELRNSRNSGTRGTPELWNSHR